MPAISGRERVSVELLETRRSDLTSSIETF